MPDVRALTSPRDLVQALALRAAVLVGERGLPAELGSDPFDADPTTLHCGAFDADGTCVGTGRLLAPLDEEVGGELVEGNPRIGPIVVAPSARGGGLARAILEFLEADALARFGNNGAVRIEAWVPDGVDTERLGYVMAHDAPAGHAPWPSLAYKDLAAS